MLIRGSLLRTTMQILGLISLRLVIKNAERGESPRRGGAGRGVVARLEATLNLRPLARQCSGGKTGWLLL